VAEDPVAQKVLSSPAEFNWGGLASTAFWVDPVERITATFFTQMIPSSTYPLRSQFRQLVYQALVD
jgi:CubicO group peptidase (beta-lactamase class C family)